MNKQSPRQKAVGWLQMLLLAKRFPEWLEQLNELAVMRRQLFDVPALAHLQTQSLGGQFN
jgi:hypothetical protein